MMGFSRLREKGLLILVGLLLIGCSPTSSTSEPAYPYSSLAPYPTITRPAPDGTAQIANTTMTATSIVEHTPVVTSTPIVQTPTTSVPNLRRHPSLIYAQVNRSLWLWQPGKAPRQLTDPIEIADPENTTGFLTWAISPNGQYLAYFHGTSSILGTTDNSSGINLIALFDDLNGTNTIQTLVADPFNSFQFDLPILMNAPAKALVWSPDSQYLAFISYHELPEGAVYIAALNGSAIRRVYDGSAEELVWSPDSQYLAFLVYDPAAPNASQLSWVSVEGSSPVQMLEAPLASGNVYGWTSNGHLVAHLYPQPDTNSVMYPITQLAVIDPVEGTQTVLLEHNRLLVADWSMEQDAFAVALYDLPNGRPNGIYLVTTDGLVEPLVTNDHTMTDHSFLLTWSPTGRYLVWTGNCCPCQYQIMEFESGERQAWPSTCEPATLRWSSGEHYLFVQEGQGDLPYGPTFTVIHLEEQSIIAQGKGPFQREGTDAAWTVSSDGRYVASITPRYYLGAAFGATIGTLQVGELGQPSSLVDADVATWGPGLTWLPIPVPLQN